MDATLLSPTEDKKREFPPRVRGCYVRIINVNTQVLVSSTGTWMLLRVPGEIRFASCFLYGYVDATADECVVYRRCAFPPRYADATLMVLISAVMCAILASYNPSLRRYE